MSPVPAILRNAQLDRDAVWQVRVDLAACFRGAAQLCLHEGVCKYLERAGETQRLTEAAGRSLKPVPPRSAAVTARRTPQGERGAARPHQGGIKRIPDCEASDYCA